MHTTRSDHIESTYISQMTRCSHIQSAAQAVPADIGKNNCAQAGGPKLEHKIIRRDATVLFPTAHADHPVSRVNSNSNSISAKFPNRICYNVRFFNCDSS